MDSDLDSDLRVVDLDLAIGGLVTSLLEGFACQHRLLITSRFYSTDKLWMDFLAFSAAVFTLSRFLRAVTRATQLPHCPALLSFCSVTHCFCYSMGK